MPSKPALAHSASVLLAFGSKLGVRTLGTVLGGCPEQSCMAKHTSSMQTTEKVWHANPESILQTMLKKTWCAVGLGASEPFENFLLALPLRAAALAVPPLARGSWMLGGS